MCQYSLIGCYFEGELGGVQAVRNGLFIYLIILTEYRDFYMIYVDKLHVVVY